MEQEPQAFHLVVTDQTMPGLSGLELAGKVRALRPDLPVVLTSGFSHTLSPTRIQAAGIAEVLSKPYSLTGLALTIRRNLSPHTVE